MRWLIMSHLIWVNAVCSPILEISIWYSLEETSFEIPQTLIFCCLPFWHWKDLMIYNSSWRHSTPYCCTVVQKFYILLNYCPLTLQCQKADDKFQVCKIKKMFYPSYIILRITRIEGKYVDPDDLGEPPHLDLFSLQVSIYSFLLSFTQKRVKRYMYCTRICKRCRPSFRSEVIKHFHAQLSWAWNFFLLINVKMLWAGKIAL